MVQVPAHVHGVCVYKVLTPNSNVYTPYPHELVPAAFMYNQMLDGQNDQQTVRYTTPLCWEEPLQKDIGWKWKSR